MRSLETLLVSIDSPPLDAVTRIVFGSIFAPLAGVFSGEPHEVLIVIALFIAALLALRVVPTVIRRLLPFSAEAKATWAERRSCSKRFDSYQWRKLFWMGLGMLPYLFVGGRAGKGVLLVTVFCLIGGGAGLVVWQRIGSAQRRRRESTS